jgi:phosphoglycolate phosphatase
LNFALQHTELDRYFYTTKTVDECFSKPHPQMIEAILEDTQIPASRAVIVGDTHYDLEMGKNAQIQRIAVSYGAQPKDILLRFEPLVCFDSFSEVVDFLLP